MKTFKQFNEGIKTIVGLGLAGYGAYNYFKNKGKKNQEQPNSNKRNVNKDNNFSSDLETGKKEIKDALKNRRGITNQTTKDFMNNPEYSDFFNKRR